jgi:hypothetical protein
MSRRPRPNTALQRDVVSALKSIEDLTLRLDSLSLSVDRMIARAEKSEKREEVFMRVLFIVAGILLGTIGDSAKTVEILKTIKDVI